MVGGEAISRVQIDAQLTDVGWNPTDGRSVHFEYTLVAASEWLVQSLMGEMFS